MTGCVSGEKFRSGQVCAGGRDDVHPCKSSGVKECEASAKVRNVPQSSKKCRNVKLQSLVKWWPQAINVGSIDKCCVE